MKAFHIVQAILLLYLTYGIAIWNLIEIARVITAISLTSVPGIIERSVKMCLPFHVKDLIAFSAMISVAGNVSGLYARYYFIYDRFAHFAAAVTLGLSVFLAIIIIIRRHGLVISDAQVIVVIIALVMALSAVWELLEGLSNSILGTGLIKNPFDTRLDYIFDLLGALAAAWFAYNQMKAKSIGEIAEDMSKRYARASPE